MSSPEAHAPRFRPGDRVAVRAANPPGHVRTPFYVRGMWGVVEGIVMSGRRSLIKGYFSKLRWSWVRSCLRPVDADSLVRGP